jgi:UPF0148 protein
MDQDEILKKITGLLEQGCTMLAEHHGCGAPLFRCKGKILCPVCSFGTEKLIDMQAKEAEMIDSKPAEAIREANEMEMLRSTISIVAKAQERCESSQEKPLGPEERSTTSVQHLAESPLIDRPEIIEPFLRKALSYKLRELSGNVKAEQDLDRLRAMLDCIEVAIRVLNALNDET